MQPGTAEDNSEEPPVPIVVTNTDEPSIPAAERQSPREAADLQQVHGDDQEEEVSTLQSNQTPVTSSDFSAAGLGGLGRIRC